MERYKNKLVILRPDLVQVGKIASVENHRRCHDFLFLQYYGNKRSIQVIEIVGLAVNKSSRKWQDYF